MSATTDGAGERIRIASEQVLSDEIETIELGLDEAMRMIDSGAIRDGKTIMLLQYAQLKLGVTY